MEVRSNSNWLVVCSGCLTVLSFCIWRKFNATTVQRSDTVRDAVCHVNHYFQQLKTIIFVFYFFQFLFGFSINLLPLSLPTMLFVAIKNENCLSCFMRKWNAILWQTAKPFEKYCFCIGNCGCDWLEWPTSMCECFLECFTSWFLDNVAIDCWVAKSMHRSRVNTHPSSND